ncbi:hypothetical protein MSKU9_0661 [Komagataeibacter diospyri]|uniref:Uncharacterized protein n=1 Tax=Komagataeibacter diospyri TaxID=1932662 RepID=A0A4P5NLC3_9PROT|nr:hypothetical protein MSKU9_0661 [Komagataeibacter diospyri]
MWGFCLNRMAVRFAYEWHDGTVAWRRSYGNEVWEFDADDLMHTRFAAINDQPITADAGLSELGL